MEFSDQFREKFYEHEPKFLVDAFNCNSLLYLTYMHLITVQSTCSLRVFTSAMPEQITTLRV